MKNELLCAILFAALSSSAQIDVTTNAAPKKVTAITNAPAKAVVAVKPVKPTKVHVLELIQDMGFWKCRTSGGLYLISNLPTETKAHLQSIKRQELEIERLKTKVPTRAKNQHNQWVTVQKSLGSTEQQNTAKQTLAKLKKDAPSFTTIFVVETTQTYAGMKVWRATGLVQGTTP